MAKKAAKKPKQQYLGDMAPPSIPEIDAAAETYYDAVQERLPLTKAEAEAKDNLIMAMVEHGQTRYEYEDKIVSLLDSKNVKVKRKKSENGDEE